jgi:dolichyl-phosphate-mannose-protein mannosyltransferase
VNLDTESNKKLASWGIIIVCTISIVLRFWDLGRFNLLVFDEVYYAKFANNYFTHTPFFNSHPPLSQYLIAIGIWIGDRLPIGRDVTNTFTGSLHSTFSYRWMNALFGSLIPPLVAVLAYQLSQRLSYAFLAALLISFDGLFLVESRYALNNIYAIVFGLLGQILILIASRSSRHHRFCLMLGAGTAFGAAAACKWNGLWFLLGIYLLIFIAKIWKSMLQEGRGDANANESKRQITTSNNSLLVRLATVRTIEIFVYLFILPTIVYSLLWIPHLIQNPLPNFIDVQWSILNYHERIGNSDRIHPYCSNWYTWPLMMRPLAYYFTQYKPNYYYDVHAMGNPLLWWLGLAAIFGSIWIVIKNSWVIFDRWRIAKASLGSIQDLNLNYSIVPLFVVINYIANLLPWVKVSRCLFIYHYMGAVLFAIMGLAWVVDVWMRSSSIIWRVAGLTTIFSVAATFVFWLPTYLGLSISGADLHYRLWDFWIFNWI